jgi:hypothetical protein
VFGRDALDLVEGKMAFAVVVNRRQNDPVVEARIEV